MLTSKQERALERYVKRTPPEQVAQAIVSNLDLKPGPFRMLPLMACIRHNESGPLPYLMVFAGVLRNYQDEHQGSLSWRVPLNDQTVPTATRLLGAMGWDGRVWPDERGWPDDVEQEASGLRVIMEESRLGQTLVFPPDAERGSRVLPFLLSRSRGRGFVLPVEYSLPEDAEVRPELEARLRALMQTPELFRFIERPEPVAGPAANP